MSDADTFTAALRDPAAAVPAGLTSWNGSNLEQRFAVHRNNRITSLLAALADGFPVVQQLVGEAFFRELSRRYIHAHPPVTPVLFEYGNRLPAFIASTEPLRPYPYLADIARLELMRTRAWHAADAPIMGPEAFAALLQTPEALASLRFVIHPSASLLRSPHAVFDIWQAHQQADAPACFNTIGAQSVLVLRPFDFVLVTQIREAEADLIAALADGACLGDALTAYLTSAPDFDIAGGLAALIRSQCVCAAQPLELNS